VFDKIKKRNRRGVGESEKPRKERGRKKGSFKRERKKKGKEKQSSGKTSADRAARDTLINNEFEEDEVTTRDNKLRRRTKRKGV